MIVEIAIYSRIQNIIDQVRCFHLHGDEPTIYRARDAVGMRCIPDIAIVCSHVSDVEQGIGLPMGSIDPNGDMDERSICCVARRECIDHTRIVERSNRLIHERKVERGIIFACSEIGNIFRLQQRIAIHTYLRN